jgi:hypothetical protein
MLQHAQHVLGVQVFFAPAAVAWAWDKLPALPGTDPRVQRSTKEHGDSPAMLLPRGGELYSIFADERHGLFAQAQGCEDGLFVLQQRWSALRQLLPADSSCLAVVYQNKAGALVMGVYDVLRVEGVDRSSLPAFERQAALFALFQQAPRLEGVEQHWVGLEHSLFKYMQIPERVQGVPFDVDYMLRLLPPVPAGERASQQYTRLLRPICTQKLEAWAEKQ